MKRASAALAAVLLLAAAPQQKPPAAPPPKDRVILKKGPAVEGIVKTDTWKEVSITSGAAVQSFKPDDVLRVEYFDAPPTFRAAIAAIEAEKWPDAISALSSAEDYANAAAKEKGLVKPRAWFPSYLAFHRGLSLLNSGGRGNDAVLQFDKIRKDFKESRFLPQAYEFTLQAHREKGDVAAMDAFEKEIDAAPPEIKGEIKARATRQRAELLAVNGKFADAKKLFDQIALASDPAIAAEGTAGVIRCLSGLKDATGVETYCKKVLSTTAQPSLQLVASNALGDAALEKKQYGAARDYYVQSVVRFNPGRGSGSEREHERGLYQLARVYEALMNETKEPKVKEFNQMSASSAFRELSIEYPSGKYREEAVAKAAKYEPKDEKK